MPSFPDLHPPLAGRTVTLRFAAERDIPEILIAHEDDPQLYPALGLDRPPSGAELGRRIDRSAADRRAGIAVWITITRAAAQTSSDVCCGQVAVHSVDWDHQRAELGIWIAPAHRGHGLAAGALELVCRWLLMQCGIERVELFTEPSNQAMIHAAAAAGFADEGVLRGYIRSRTSDRRVDARVMSMISADLVTAAS
jgi:ribosomal-protein-alanine N-acetyltransferase